LENFLSSRRSRMADQLILPSLRTGKILDIGCGVVPHFLLRTSFHRKYGIDPSTRRDLLPPDVTVEPMLIEKNKSFPYEDHFFDVVTSLGVIEHFDTDTFGYVLKEIHRVLKRGGQFILTTPSPWSRGLLKGMARRKLISVEEIALIQRSYPAGALKALLVEAGFEPGGIRAGYFEFFLNSWVVALKTK